MNQLFGTDGIRGAFGRDMTPRLCFYVGRALAALTATPTVVVGRDPRPSGESLTAALVSGLTAGGATALTCGVVPTPALSFLMQKRHADFGVMITASHNPKEDNGIKIFNRTGQKITRCQELRIESLVHALFRGEELPYICGKVKRISAKPYREHLESLPPLTGISVALDLARGSACTYAARAFQKLGATVYLSGRRDFSGRLGINENCGATHPAVLSAFTKKCGADLGFAFDGDADRVLLCDKRGKLYGGDEILYLLSVWRGAEEVVGTVTTNGGIEAALLSRGVGFSRAAVGDRNVTAQMIERGATLGAESSGHVVFFPEMITGDGIFTALFIAGLYRTLGEGFYCRGSYVLYPQVSLSVSTARGKDLLSLPMVKEAIAKANGFLGERGMLLVRPSGTENKIRILAESQTLKKAKRAATEVQTALITAQQQNLSHSPCSVASKEV